MQLSRDELLKAYRQMRTIREFEDTVHDEFAAGNIPGFVHLYAGEEASAVGVCLHLNDKDHIASTHRGHGHCIAKGCDLDGDDGRDLRPQGRPVRRQGRLDAHRRPVQGHDGRQRHRRRRAAPDLRRRALRQDAQDRRRRDRLRRRWRLQPGHHRREPEPRQGLEPAGDLRLRGQRLRRIHRQPPGRAPAIWSSAARPTASRRAGSTATISSRSGMPRAKRSSAPATARGRASCTSS